jgi:chorismate synthase
MAGSSIGTLFILSTFGESHGVAIGGIIDGFPAGFSIDLDAVQAELDRRKPGQSNLVTPRKESDRVQFLSGISNGISLGTPIGFIIPNEDQRSKDYDQLEEAFRPSHADYTYFKKYGIHEHRGGGRSSARETACRVVAGALAKQYLQAQGIQFSTYVDHIGHLQLHESRFYTLEEIEATATRCPDLELSQQMESLILQTKKDGDTLGGSIRIVVQGVPAGLGEPVFDKLHACLGKAFFSINAVKGVSFGSGFDAVKMLGSEHNDLFNSDGTTKTNFSGGIQGGISNAMPIEARIAFKPVSSILKTQQTINKHNNEVELEGKGRHDACVVPRAVPIVEAMCAMVLLDFFLMQRAYQ